MTSTAIGHEFTGGCECGELRYRLIEPPLFNHACHCLKCQKNAGSAFGITSIVLLSDIAFTQGEPEPAKIGARSTAYRCDSCKTDMYVVSTAHPATALLRPGTLDDLRDLIVHAHIWVKRKHPWISLPDGIPQFDEGYERDSTWPTESLNRLQLQLDHREPE